ncbi:hypothetical protein EFO35_04735 [Lactococcus cremoris]|uniref:hypothetical protein n=1 Tax=Lactococcus lactis subsp. cremoris TaxID=1359 RepID=UPI0021AA717B|nr:hypothetical protein [Lactococcus cremoris]MCT4454367.1 hypothetical protein [Lactococcus cremoris]
MATIDITEQAPGTQSSTFKIEDLEKARTFENKHFLILSVKMNSEIGHQVILKSVKNKKAIIIFNQNKAPFRIKITREIAEKYRIKQEIKQTQKKTDSPNGLYPLIEAIEKDISQLLNKQDKDDWEGWKRVFAYECLYNIAFNRGVRQERQRRKTKRKALTAFDVISADDVIELSNELGINEDRLTYAVLEVISKRKNGGKK